MLGRMLSKLALLEDQLPAARWLGGFAPAVADFLIAEAVEAHRHLLGPTREGALSARLPRLTATSRPDEPALLARLRALDLSPSGL